MHEKTQIEIDAFELDGQRLCFEQGVILMDEMEAGQPRWQVVFFHPRLDDAEPSPVAAPMAAHTVAGEQLVGRIWRGSFAHGAGSLILHGIGPLQNSEAADRMWHPCVR